MRDNPPPAATLLAPSAMATTQPTLSLGRLYFIRAGSAIAAIVLPLVLGYVFQRQAGRLDVLAAEGEPVRATVTGISRDRGITYYSYRVGRFEREWNVRREDAPYEVGQSFDAIYSPSDPSLTRPYADRSRAADDAARSRSTGWKVVLGLGAFFALVAFAVHHDLMKRMRGEPVVALDPAAYRRRMIVTWVGLVVLVILVIVGPAIGDEERSADSNVALVMALGLSIALITGTMAYVAKNGPEAAQSRAANLMGWVAPAALGLAVLRVVLASACGG